MVYVDRDSVVIVHARSLLARANPYVTVTRGDLNEPEEILASPATQKMIKFDRPAAVLLVAIMHFFADDDRVRDLLGRVMTPMAPGSFLVLSHLAESESAHKILQTCREQVRDVRTRTRPELAALVPAGLEPFGPGAVGLHAWKGEGDVVDDLSEMGIGAVFRKS